jgi:hypothetical protein
VGASRAQREALDIKIGNIRRDAEKKAKGVEHSRGNKR